MSEIRTVIIHFKYYLNFITLELSVHTKIAYLDDKCTWQKLEFSIKLAADFKVFVLLNQLKCQIRRDLFKLLLSEYVLITLFSWLLNWFDFNYSIGASGETIRSTVTRFEFRIFLCRKVFCLIYVCNLLFHECIYAFFLHYDF